MNENYQKIFNDALPLLKKDISITNLECPLSEKESPIKKSGPNLVANPKCVEAIKYGGFDVIALANKHVLDQGESGLKDTLGICRESGIETVGAGENIEDASRPLYMNVKGKRIAVLNCAEHEFSIAKKINRVLILNILKAASRKFDVTFLTVCDYRDMLENEESLGSCSHTILLPPRNRKNLAARVVHMVLSGLACFATGMPSEFYYSSILNLSPERIRNVLNGSSFNVVLFEYWFATKSLEYFRKIGVPYILDMHDVLWRKRITSRNHNASNILGKKYRDFLDARYRLLEEATWQRFDHLIAINHEEALYVSEKMNSNISMITAGTGVNLNEWPYCWAPATPPRIVFYGSLSGKENEAAALRCANRIMPLIWSKTPNAELWLVGANPTSCLLALQTNLRIKRGLLSKHRMCYLRPR